MSWEWLLALAPFLLLLACTLVMWSMMKGMGMSDGAGSQRDCGAESGGGDAGLQREVEVLRARVAEIEGASATRTGGPRVRS